MDESTKAMNVFRYCKSQDDVAFKEHFDDVLGAFCDKTKKCPPWPHAREIFIDKFIENLPKPSNNDFENEVALILNVKKAVNKQIEQMGSVQLGEIRRKGERDFDVKERMTQGTIEGVKHVAKDMYDSLYYFVFDEKEKKNE